MTFDDWMVGISASHKPSDDGITLRMLRACWDGAQAAERERWVVACNAISGDLRNHDVVRMTAAKCLDAGLRGPNVRAKRATTAGRQARAGENVQSTTGPGLVACRWRSA